MNKITLLFKNKVVCIFTLTTVIKYGYRKNFILRRLHNLEVLKFLIYKINIIHMFAPPKNLGKRDFANYLVKNIYFSSLVYPL